MKKKKFLYLLIVFLSLGCIYSAPSHADEFASFEPTSDLKNSLAINVNENELQIQYGVYSEIELSLYDNDGVISSNVSWSIDAESFVPQGMELEDTVADKALIFGTPQFTESWCFVIRASIAEKNVTTSRELCIVAEDDENITHPRFKSDRYMSDAVINRNYTDHILVDTDIPSFTFRGSVIASGLPENLSILVSEQFKTFSIVGKPRLEELGTYMFILSLGDELTGNEIFKQFQISVVKPEETETVNCPGGYYYDTNLGYCVQNSSSRCPDGTYYEPSVNQCVQYPSPPPTIICRPGYHFDHFLGQCVLNSHPRCPLNYKWDAFENRCVRMPHTCSFGEYYSWDRQECLPIWSTTCSYGYHYDYYLQRCVANYRSCAYGYYWDYSRGICVRNQRLCGYDEHWDPVFDRCVRNYQHCSPGYEWDRYLERCVRQNRERLCAPGWHWSYEYDRCVEDRRPAPRPRPEPNPHPQPRPMPAPMPQPEPMPWPMPDPQPQPRPMPAPMPQPEPMPWPMPDPQPQPRPMPAPQPQPEPMPWPMPQPDPNPHPQPRPMPGPDPMPDPRPTPVPGPMPRPRT